MSLGSESKWHFDDQAFRNVYSANIILRTGDLMQTTCVMDTRSRSKATIVGQETSDEMCWQQVSGWSEDGSALDAKCKGYFWSGTLADGESALGIAEHHPYTHAPAVWDGSNMLTGGAQIMENGNKLDICSDNLSICDKTAMMGMFGITCGSDLGSIQKKLAGTTVMDQCCKTACEAKAGICKDFQTCKDKIAEQGQKQVASLPVLSWAAKYTVQVPSCSDGDGPFMTLELDAPPVPAPDTSSSTSETSSAQKYAAACRLIAALAVALAVTQSPAFPHPM